MLELLSTFSLSSFLRKTPKNALEHTVFCTRMALWILLDSFVSAHPAYKKFPGADLQAGPGNPYYFLWIL